MNIIRYLTTIKYGPIHKNKSSQNPFPIPNNIILKNCKLSSNQMFSYKYDIHYLNFFISAQQKDPGLAENENNLFMCENSGH